MTLPRAPGQEKKEEIKTPGDSKPAAEERMP